ncbi:hypothetical protein [Paraflavitalea speifideaquila]|uniref:hypothetical protein n=1 Tax=Paraflavitalea speifideaquila TaxID=3076558 RepID=UPI0028EF9C87|nr:hypothetical protein [Paraflavitalea speifideiaquila]
MSRLLLILVAFSILNQSIDLDYLTIAMRAHPSGVSAKYDDPDSITEYLLEQLMDDDDFIPDHDDDNDGMPKNNSVERFSWEPFCCQFAHKVVIIPTDNTAKAAQKPI